MKILFVSHAYVERANHRKLELLSKNEDLKVGVVYPSFWKTWHGEEKRSQNSEHRTQNSYAEFPLDPFFSGNWGRYIYNPIQLIISILNFRPDIVHLEEEPFTPVAFQVALLSIILRFRLTFFTWENIVDLNLGWRRKVMEVFVFRTAVGGLAGTNGAKERLVKRGFDRQIEVIPQFGVDSDLFYPSIRPRLANVVVVGFVGRPTLDKGIDVLFRALSKLPEKYQLLWVTSSPSIPPVIRDQIRSLGLEYRVRIETNIPHEKLSEYYHQMDIFVLPSRTTYTWKEQFGRTLVEAMASGVPVVGSSSGAIPEVVGEAGLIFKEEDATVLANILDSLADPKERDRLREKGLRRVFESYSLERIVESLYKFFKDQI